MANHANTGGILSIAAGAFGVLWALLFIIVFYFLFFRTDEFQPSEAAAPIGLFLIIISIIYAIFGIFYLLVGALGIVGGIFALRKRRWGVALAGAIAGSFTFFPCGIPAIIFVTLAKPEFSAKKPRRRRR